MSFLNIGKIRHYWQPGIRKVSIFVCVSVCMNTCVFKRFSSYLMATGLWGFFIFLEIVLWLIFKRYLSHLFFKCIGTIMLIFIIIIYLVSAASIMMCPSFIPDTGYVFSFFIIFTYLFLFLAVLGLLLYRLFSSCSTRASHCGGFSCCRAQALGCVGSVVVVHGLIFLETCGIFWDQGSNLCSFH